MERHRSSAVPWFGIFLVSSSLLVCHAYPDGRFYENFIHTIDRREVSSSDTVEDVPVLVTQRKQGYDDQSIQNEWHHTKRHVSNPVKTLETLKTRKIRDTSSIDDNTNEDEIIKSNVNLKDLDDLPETLDQTIEKDNDSELKAVPGDYNDVMEYFSRVSMLYGYNFWNSLSQRLSKSAISESIRSFLRLPTNDVLQIDEAERKKRETTCCAEAKIEVPECHEGPKSPSIDSIIKELLPLAATAHQKNEMRKCVTDVNVELQNLLDHFKKTCGNIREKITMKPPPKCEHHPPPKCEHHPPPKCEHHPPPKCPDYMENAPVLLQKIIESPEKLEQIPEILQTSVPCSLISDSADKLKDSFKKMYGLLKSDSEVEESDCSEERHSEEKQPKQKQPKEKQPKEKQPKEKQPKEKQPKEKSHSCCKRKRLEKINKNLDKWKKKRKDENQCCDGELSLCNSPSTVIVSIPAPMDMKHPVTGPTITYLVPSSESSPVDVPISHTASLPSKDEIPVPRLAEISPTRTYIILYHYHPSKLHRNKNQGLVGFINNTNCVDILNNSSTNCIKLKFASGEGGGKYLFCPFPFLSTTMPAIHDII